MVAVARSVQLENAPTPMETTLSGIVTDTTPRLSANAWSVIRMTPSGISSVPARVPSRNSRHPRRGTSPQKSMLHHAARSWMWMSGVPPQVPPPHPRLQRNSSTPLPMATLCRLLHPENAKPPMNSTLSGRITDTRLVQPWNVSRPIPFTLSPTTTEVTPLQYKSASSLMPRTFDRSRSPVHPVGTSSTQPSSSTSPGTVHSSPASDAQPPNAYISMPFRLSGNVTSTRLSQSWNA